MDKKIWGIIGGLVLVLALLSPFVLGSTKKVERIFEDAEELYEQGQYEDAIAKYNKVLKEAKKVGVKIETIDADFTARVNYKIACCLKLLDRVDEALQHYRFIAFQFPDSQYATDSYVDSGDIYFGRKDYEAASEAYKRALDTIGDAERRKQIHQKYQQTLVLINPPIPEQRLSEAEEIETPNFSALTEATFLRFEKRFEKAATQYEVFANDYLPFEDGVYALYWAGRCYYDAALFPQSVDAFQRLINDYAYSPNAIEAYHGLAKAYYSWAERDRDRSKCQLVISTVEEAKRLYAGKDDTKVGNWLRRMQVIQQKAVEKLNDKYEPDPPPPADLVQQGLANFNRDELDTAKRKAEQALNLDPNYSPADELLSKIKVKYYDRGLEFLDTNRYSEAINVFDKVISIDTQYKEAHFHLGVAYFNLRNYTYAENAVRAALDIDSEYEEARRLLAEITEGRD